MKSNYWVRMYIPNVGVIKNCHSEWCLGFAGVPDRSRVNHGLERGHGIGPVGEPDSERFGPDQKTLIQEFEDETDLSDVATPCGWEVCAGDQFLCAGSCTCVSMEQRCDGTVRIHKFPNPFSTTYSIII